MFEALNAVLSGSSRGLVRAIQQFGDAADAAGDEAFTAAAQTEAFEGQAEDVAQAAGGALPSTRLLASQFDEAGDKAFTAAAQTEAFEGQAEDVAQAAAGALPPTRALASQFDETGDEALGAAIDMGVFGSSLGAVGATATGTTLPLTALQNRFDEVGDEAVAATLSTGALVPALGATSAASSSTAGASTALSTSLSGVSVSASTSAVSLGVFAGVAGAALGVVIALVEAAIGLGAALAGVATAATAGGAALAGLFLGGLLPIAERIKQSSEDVETVFEGLSKLFERVGRQAAAALAPLRGVDGFQGLAIGALNGAVELLALGAQTAAGLADTLRPISRQIGAVVDAVAPQVFGELAQSVRTLAPLVEDALVGTLQAVPGVIRSLTAAAQELAPDLRALGANLVAFAPQVVAFAVDVARLVIPALNAFLNLATDLNRVVVPVFDALVDATLAVADGAGDVVRIIQGLSPLAGDIASLARQTVRFGDALALAARNGGELVTALQAVEGDPTAIADITQDGLNFQTELPDRSGLFDGPGPAPAPPAERPADTLNLTVESVTVGSGTSDREAGRRVGREVERALREKRRDQGGGTSG